MLEGRIVLPDVGLEVNLSAFHLMKSQQCLVTGRRRASYILRRSPEAELESVVVGNVSVCGSANGLNCTRRVLDRHVLRELPAISGIFTSLLSSDASIDMYRCVGSGVLGLIGWFVVSRRHCRRSGDVK